MSLNLSFIAGIGATALPTFHTEDRNKILLSQSLERLTRDSMLVYTGEYGAEVTTFIPFVAWLKQEGMLRHRRIRTYAGMRPHYFFLSDDEIEFKIEPRNWLPVRDRYWPSNSTYHATASPWHVYPDYRQHYASKGLLFQRPLIVIQNKFTIEWEVGPINYIPISALYQFLARVSDRFTVVYSRPGSVKGKQEGYSRDHNLELAYPDSDVSERYPGVIHLEKLCADQELQYNQTKLEVLAKSHLFVAVQGGGAHILAAFGNSLMLLLDREEYLGIDGREYPHAYQRGPYKYLAKVPPRLLVTRTFRDFIEGLQLMRQASVVNGSIVLPSNLRLLAEKWTL